mgnify:CR=1 FL=1
MAYQFIHVETYARSASKNAKVQRTTGFVFAENGRSDPSACLHVEHPEPPALVYGMSVEDCQKLHDEACAAAKTTNAKGQSRGIRKDQQTLFTAVLSYPGDTGESPGIAPYEEWEARSVAWLKEKYGDDLKTVVRHTDEAHPHLHALIVPKNLRASDLHPGVSAKAKVTENGKKPALSKAGNVAYKAAMRDFQDDFWQAVGLPCGMTRLGANKRRLSKKEYQQEREQAERARLLERQLAQKTAEFEAAKHRCEAWHVSAKKWKGRAEKAESRCHELKEQEAKQKAVIAKHADEISKLRKGFFGKLATARDADLKEKTAEIRASESEKNDALLLRAQRAEGSLKRSQNSASEAFAKLQKQEEKYNLVVGYVRDCVPGGAAQVREAEAVFAERENASAGGGAPAPVQEAGIQHDDDEATRNLKIAAARESAVNAANARGPSL